VAVLPESQGEGIGSSLVEAGLRELRQRGARGCVLVGDPGFNGRFGFKSLDSVWYAGVPSQYVLCLPFSGDPPTGEVQADPAFSAGSGADSGFS
jgi:putative acetyltransferase